MTGQSQHEHELPENEAVLTESEWQAVMLGSRALRDAAAEQRRAGTNTLAAENEQYAAALLRLGQRAEVAAARGEAVEAAPAPDEQVRAEYEALTDPFDEAVLLSQAAEGQPVEHLWRERSRELDELRSHLRGPQHRDAASETGDPDLNVLEAAGAALERRAAGLRASTAAFPPDVTFDYAGQADEAAAHAETLRTLDPAERLDQSRIDALHAGQQALLTEMDGWRSLAEAATTADWRAEFDAQAAEAERLRTGAADLQQRLEERDRDAEQECER